MDKEEDLPKSILVVLVLLAVMISVLGTFTVLHEMKKFQPAPVYGEVPKHSGRVSVQLEDVNEGKSFGKVRLELLRNPEE